MRRALSAWGPVAAWCAVIFAFSSVPNLSSGLEYDYPLRKCAHMFEYGVLWLLLRRAGLKGVPAFAFAVAYAASDEFHQTFVPGRHGAVLDVAIDAGGAALAALASLTLRR